MLAQHLVPEVLGPRNPYLGPRPFTLNDAPRFFGRDRETAELFDLVAAHRTVLLYAQSGAGKTSLLNAALIPKLNHQGFDVLPVARVFGLIPEAGSESYIGNVYAANSLAAWADGAARTGSPPPRTLRQALETRPRLKDSPGDPLTRVAVFDQFEELFTAYPERWPERRAFFEQLAEAMEADASLRVFFAMREDYLAGIDPYEDILPEELRTCSQRS